MDDDTNSHQALLSNFGFHSNLDHICSHMIFSSQHLITIGIDNTLYHRLW